MMSRAINAARSTAPTTDPTTIPAIAPPDNPPFFTAPAVADADLEDVGDAVGALVEKVMNPLIVGRTTPAQRSSAPEL